MLDEEHYSVKIASESAQIVKIVNFSQELSA